MRGLALLLGLAGCVCAQTMTEFGAAAAGGATGGAAGKKVSEGVSSVFGKVGQQMSSAAKQGSDTRQAAVAPAPAPRKTIAATSAASEFTIETVPVRHPSKKTPTKWEDDGQVPPPPGSADREIRTARKATKIVAWTPVETLAMVPPAALPGMHVTTPEDLKGLPAGATRADLLRLGEPASKISMFQDGHLAETYRYGSNSEFGVVRLTDGVVSSVDVR